MRIGRQHRGALCRLRVLPALWVPVLSASLASYAAAQEPARRHRAPEGEVPTRSVTSDGRFRLYAQEAPGGGDHLFVQDLVSGDRHPLTEGPGTASEGIFSPDGALVAYGWASPAYEWPAEDRLVELRVAQADGSGSRVLYSNRDTILSGGVGLNLQLNPAIRLHEWSPDGKYVAAALYSKDRSRLVLFSVADASVRVLRTQGLETLSYISYFGAMRFSPDGRFVAYDLVPEGGAPRDIFVTPAEGGPETAIAQHQADDILLDWTPDGGSILFASDRAGQLDLWIVRVLGREPGGSAEMVYPNIGPFARGLGFSGDGSYYYGVRVWESDVYLATLDPLADRLRDPRRLVVHVGSRTSTQWSPDGRYLAYAWGTGATSGVGSDLDPFILGIRSTDTGEERRFQLGELQRHGGHGFDPKWSPDGRFILADARERGYLRGQGLYRIDVETGGVAAAVLTDSSGGYSRIESPAWSSDGRVIFEQRPPQRLLTRDLETGQETELYRPIPPAQIHHWPTSNLAISPDGRSVVFVASDGETVGRTTTLMILPTGGGRARELLRARDPVAIGVPAWTPDSRAIIYSRTVAGEEGMFEFWRVSADGGEPRDLGLKIEGMTPYGLSVHPDGRVIAFTAGTEERTEVWVIEDVLPGLGN